MKKKFLWVGMSALAVMCMIGSSCQIKGAESVFDKKDKWVTVAGEATQDGSELFPMEAPNGMWGYLNRNGEVILFPQYEEAGMFSSNGMALVKKDGKWGYIDTSGKWVLEPKASEEYYSASTITSVAANPGAALEIERSQMPLLPFEIYGKWGFVSIDGNVVVPFEYDYVEEYDQGRAIVRKGDQYGILNESGKEIVTPSYDEILSFNESGIALFQKDSLYGVMNRNGEVLTSDSYIYIDEFARNGLAVVSKMKDGNYKYGFMNERGEEVIPCQYDSAQSFGEYDYAVVGKAGKYGLIDKNGVEVIAPTYEYMKVDAYSEYKLVTAKAGEKYGIVNMKTAQVGECRYDSIYYYDEQRDLVSITIGEKEGIADVTGKVIVEPNYDYIYGYTEDNLALMMKDGKYGYLDLEGKEVIEAKYDDAWAFYNGRTIVQVGEKYGMIDKAGNMLLEPIYDYIIDLVDLDEALSGTILAVKGEEFGIITINGEIKKEFQTVSLDETSLYQIISYEQMEYVEEMEVKLIVYLYQYLQDSYPFIMEKLNYDYIYTSNDEGYSVVENNYQYGIIDAKGELVLPIEYDYILEMESGIYFVVKDGKYGLIGKKGEILVEAIYDDIKEKTAYGLYPVRRNGIFGYINDKGEWVLLTIEP